MSRVRLVEASEAPLLARPFYADGDPGPIVAALAQVPELLDVAMPFIGATLGPSFVPFRAKELVILRTSAVLRCRYCVEAHTVAASEAGLGAEELQGLRDERPFAEVFDSPEELALLQWVDELALGRGTVDELAATTMRLYWGEPAMVELTVLVGTTMMLNRLCTGLELPTSPETLSRLAELGFAR
jgi:AhpD family alkylhydroperoxidase